MAIIELTPSTKVLPQGETIELTPPEQEQVGLVEGVGQSLLQGATLGFSDEVQSLIAAAVASPFVSDKTFGELMQDARKSFREEQEQFRKEQPAAALTAEIAGSIATGGVLAGGVKQLTGRGLREAIKQSAKTGAQVGAIAGTGFADEEDFLSAGTAEATAKGIVSGAVLGGFTPAAIKGAVSLGKLVPESVPQKLLETALKFRPSINQATRSRMTQTALREGILPNVKGLQKITDKLEILDNSLDEIIDTATQAGKTIPKKALFTELSALRKDIGGVKLEAGTDLKLINSVVKSFDEQLKKIKKTNLTPREVQNLKTDAYKRINFDIKQGTASIAKNETRKAIARSAKQQLEKIDPLIKPTNKQLGQLIELREELDRVVSRLDNRNIISLDTAAKVGAGAATGTTAGTAVGTGAAVLGAPRVKARIALALENIRQLQFLTDQVGNRLPPPLIGPLGVIIGETQNVLKDEVQSLEP